jgi:uncharacterized membrane protein
VIGSVVIIVAGALVTASGVLGWLERLPRNRLAGIRTPATMRSDRAFVAGNRAAGPATTAGGLAAAIAGVLALVLPDQERTGCLLVGVLVMLGLVVAGAIQATSAAGRTDD